MVTLSLKDTKAFTIMELLITSVLVSMVFLGAISVYLSSIRYMRTAEQADVTRSPAIGMQTLAERIGLGNAVWVTGGNQQLDIRADYACGSFTSQDTPANTADDRFWHFRFTGGALRTVCDAAQGTVVGAGAAILIENVDAANSSFALVNINGTGTANVVRVRVAATNPATTLATDVAVGAMAK